MTMVLGYKLKNEAVIIADSRASSINHKGEVVASQDRLQKIFPITNKLVVGLAGNVSLANSILETISGSLSRKKSLRHPTSFVKKLSKLSKFKSTKTKLNPKVEFLIIAIESANVTLWKIQYPDFNPVEVEDFYLIGSGSVIDQYLRDHKDEIEKTSTDSFSLANTLFPKVGSQLGIQGAKYVGGLLQIFLVNSDGIRPFRYGYAEIDPDGQPEAKDMEMIKGKWRQRNLSKGIAADLVVPIDLLSKSYQRDSVFHDYNIPENKKPKWHLSYLLTCLGAELSTSHVKFSTTFNQIAKVDYPLNVNCLVALGFWGSVGTYELKATIQEADSSETAVLSKSITIDFLPQQKDEINDINLTINKPGLYFIKVYIDNYLLGRKPIYFHKINTLPQPTDNEVTFARKVQNEVKIAENSLEDADMEKTQKSEIVYFFICESSAYSQNDLVINNEFIASYWDRYPLPMRAHIASAFRMPKGKHSIELKLVNVFDASSQTIDTATITATSSYVYTPVHSDVIIKFQNPGLYYISAYVDSKRACSLLIAAETSEPRWSYTLLPEQVEAVKNGELLNLSKRASQAGS